jgi:hypothetical protein
MRITRIFLFLSLLIGWSFASAQVSISASHVADAFERPITNAKLCFAPVDAASNPAGFRVGSVQVVPGAVCGLINNGVLQSGLSVAPSPAGLYYHLWAASRSNNAVIRDFGMTPITGSSWTLDTYDPAIVTVPASALTMGSVTTLPPGSSASCNLTGGNPYALNCAIPQAPGATEVSPSTQYTIPTYDSNSDLVHLGPSRVTTDANGDLAVPNNLSAGSANIAGLFASFVNGSTSVTSPWIQGKLIGSVYQVDQFGTGSFDQLINACITYGAIYGQQTLAGNSVGNFTCDARRLTSNSNGPNTLTAAGDINVTNSGVHVLLPCQSVNMGINHIIIKNTPTYNVGSDVFEGCGQDATWLVFTGNDTFVKVGDPTFTYNTSRVAFKHLAIMTNTAGQFATAMAFYRTQDITMEDVELNGKGGNSSTIPPSSQLGILLDGTGNYTGGSFRDVHINSYPMGIDMTGHDSGNVVGDFANASTFERLHINCPTIGGYPNGNGIYAEAADGNTWVGGDIEGCYKMVELGANAINNTFIGVRNENSNIQYQADSGSSFNLVISGGTLFTNQLIDYGSRNSFIDAFHHTQNGVKGDWYASQQDATVVNHLRLGTGSGNVRGLQWETQVDQGTSSSVYNWLWGLTDGAGGSQQWMFQDLINNTVRLLMGQNNTAGGNNQTALNAAGTGNVCFNCSSNSGTGGVAYGSGGASPTTVGTIDASGNQTLYGYQRFFAGSAEAWRFNCASSSACNVDSYTSGSGVHHLRLYNGSGTDIDSEGSSAVTVNNTSGSGTGGFIVYEGGANYNTPALTVTSSGAASTASNFQAGAANGTGNVVVGNHLNQIGTGDFAGSCTMSSSTSCMVSFQHSWTSTPACVAAPQGTTPMFAAVSVSSNNVTVTASASNSATWNVVCPGNPN